MYNSKTINQRIAILLKSKPFNQRQLLENCELNINLLNKMTDNKGIGCFALAKIADHLETSTDYLLGRTDIPDMVVENKNVINGVTVASPVQVIGAEKPLDELTAEFVKQFKGLSYQDKLDIMQAVAEKYEVKKG